MEPQNSTHLTKSLSIIIVACIVGGAIGVVVTAAADPYLPIAFSNAKKGYQAGFSDGSVDAISRVERAASDRKNDMNHFNGIVTALHGNRVDIHLQSFGNPFDETEILDRTITIASTTKVVLITETSLQVFSRKDSSVGDVHVGNEIMVSASKNIKMEKTFIPDTVYIRVPY